LVFFCGSGFAAATIEAESRSRKKNFLADKVAPRAAANFSVDNVSAVALLNF
jgi:hypothetical protein